MIKNFQICKKLINQLFIRILKSIVKEILFQDSKNTVQEKNLISKIFYKLGSA